MIELVDKGVTEDDGMLLAYLVVIEKDEAQDRAEQSKPITLKNSH